MSYIMQRKEKNSAIMKRMANNRDNFGKWLHTPDDRNNQKVTEKKKNIADHE